MYLHNIPQMLQLCNNCNNKSQTPPKKAVISTLHTTAQPFSLSIICKLSHLFQQTYPSNYSFIFKHNIIQLSIFQTEGQGRHVSVTKLHPRPSWQPSIHTHSSFCIHSNITFHITSDVSSKLHHFPINIHLTNNNNINV